MASVTAKHEKGGKRNLEHVHIRRMANGVSVHKQYSSSGEGPMMRHEEDPPMVFQKHGPALKHVRSALAEMNPGGIGEEVGE